MPLTVRTDASPGGRFALWHLPRHCDRSYSPASLRRCTALTAAATGPTRTLSIGRVAEGRLLSGGTFVHGGEEVSYCITEWLLVAPERRLQKLVRSPLKSVQQSQVLGGQDEFHPRLYSVSASPCDNEPLSNCNSAVPEHHLRSEHHMRTEQHLEG